MAISDQELLGYNPESQDIDRKRKLAELLMAQGMKQPQGQMISGRYVAPAFTQNLATLYNSYQGNRIGEEQDQRQLALAEQLRKQEGEDLSRFYELQYGGKQIPAQAQAGPMPDGGNIPIGTTTSEADPRAAFEMGMKSRSPAIRAQLAEMLKDKKVGEGETITRYNPMTGRNESIAEGGMKVAPEVKQAMQQLGINKPLEQLSPQELQAVNAKISQLNESKRSNVSVNIPTEGERKAGFMANILDKNILQMQKALKIDPTAVKPNVPASVVEAIAGPNLLSRTITPAQRQVIEDSQLDVLDAALTLRTGAAYTKEQLNGMRDTYFPKLGDAPAAINAKKQRLETLLDGAYIASGRATPPRVSEVYAPPSPKSLSETTGGPNMRPQGAVQAPRFLGFEKPGQ